MFERGQWETLAPRLLRRARSLSPAGKGGGRGVSRWGEVHGHSTGLSRLSSPRPGPAEEGCLDRLSSVFESASVEGSRKRLGSVSEVRLARQGRRHARGRSGGRGGRGSRSTRRSSPAGGEGGGGGAKRVGLAGNCSLAGCRLLTHYFGISARSRPDLGQISLLGRVQALDPLNLAGVLGDVGGDEQLVPRGDASQALHQLGGARRHEPRRDDLRGHVREASRHRRGRVGTEARRGWRPAARRGRGARTRCRRRCSAPPAAGHVCRVMGRVLDMASLLPPPVASAPLPPLSASESMPSTKRSCPRAGGGGGHRPRGAGAGG